jgi:uncharacterized OB-fold protein
MQNVERLTFQSGALKMSPQSQPSNAPPVERKPIREGLFEMEPPALLGSICSHCGTATFPPRDFCPACLADGPHPVRPLERSGSVFSYTVVHQAPGGRRTPYVLGYVDLQHDRVRVLSQIDVPPERVSIGMRVSLVLREVATAEGVPVVNYAFAPDALNMGATQ